MAKENETPEPEEEKAGATPEVTLASEEHDALNKLKEYILPIALGATLAIVLSASIMGYKSYKEGLKGAASDLLARADTPEKLEKIVLEYPESPSAPVALLTLASDYFHEESYTNAVKYYSQLIKEYPNNIGVPAARVGLGYCYEAMGNYASGLETFGAFETKSPDHYLVAMATFGKARCLAGQGKFDEARTVYEDYIAANPDKGWKPQAEMALRQVEMDGRAKLLPPRKPAKPPVAEVKTPPTLGPSVAPGTDQPLIKLGPQSGPAKQARPVPKGSAKKGPIKKPGTKVVPPAQQPIIKNPQVEPVIKLKPSEPAAPAVDAGTPEAKKPTVLKPEVNVPKVPKVPEVKVPEVKAPEVKLPEVKKPEVKLPKVPEVKTPEVKLPEVKVPEVKKAE